MRYDFSKFFKETIKNEGGKIILCVLDGLGGIPSEKYEGKTELEFARTPNLDKLAKISSKGLHIPVEYGVTPGSGPSHLALFGYDPIENVIKRGVMEAMGIGILPERDEIFARGNFAKAILYENRIKVVDRRAGRLSTEKNKELCELINRNVSEIDGVKIKFFTVKEHRVCVSFLGEGLSDEIEDTDPQKDNEFLRESKPYGEPTFGKQKLSRVVNELSSLIFDILKGEESAQCILLRGFSKVPNIQSFEEKWKMKALAIASYPMYRGIARILGMDIAELKDGTLQEQITVLKSNFKKYDFFYLHFKKTDSAGEDGDFLAKVKAIEEFDSVIDDILELNPEVLAITGDHSTPSELAYHSFHPVPILIHSRSSFKDYGGRFTERDCANGSLGIIYATAIMPILLANAGRLEKFGA